MTKGIFTPERLERDYGYKVLWDLMGFVLAVQCPKCGKATPAFPRRVNESERINGYDHPAYLLCDCSETPA